MNNLKKYFLLALVVFISGCGVWNDFTTYFNLYYNLSSTFDEAETKIKEGQTELFLFKQKPLEKDVNALLDKVIDKSSKILQFNSSSSYFEDALFMAGKAFYYKEDFPKALRKFKELQGRETEEFELISRLWIGKTLLQQREYSDGMNILDKLKEAAIAAERNDVAVEVMNTQIGYFIFRENFTAALDYCREMIPVLEEKEMAANVYFEMGFMYSETDNLDEAEKAFKLAIDSEPSFEVEFNSQFEIGKIESIRKNYDNAVIIFEQLKEEDKYSTFFDRLDLEIANIKYEKGELEAAMEAYINIDSLYKTTPSAGEAAYKMSLLYAEYFQNYDSANVYNEKAFASQADEEILRSARAKRPVFAKYFEYRKDLIKYDTQFLYLTDSTAFIKDSLIFAAKIDSINKEKEREEVTTEEPKTNNPRPPTNTNRRTSDAQPNPADLRTVPGQLAAPMRPRISIDSLKSKVSDTYYEIANLFYTEFNVRDSAKYYYELTLNKYPGSTRNREKTMYALGNYYQADGMNEKADSIFNYIYVNSSDASMVNEAAKKINKPQINTGTDPLEDQMYSAEELYDSSDFYTAASEYFNIYKFNPSSKLAPKALYAAGFIYENNLNIPEKAFNYYDTLAVKYPNTEYAKNVRPKVEMYRQEQISIKQKLKAVQDSIAAANAVKDSIAAKELIPEEKSIPDDNILRDRNLIDKEVIQSPDSNSVPLKSLEVPDSSSGIPGSIKDIPAVKDSTKQDSVISDHKINTLPDSTQKRIKPER